MIHRRLKPSPARDWRALAMDRPQQVTTLPVHAAGDDSEFELRLRRNGNDRPVVTLTGSMSTDNPAELRTLADRSPWRVVLPLQVLVPAIATTEIPHKITLSLDGCAALAKTLLDARRSDHG